MKRLMGQLERRAEAITCNRGVQLAGCCKHTVGVSDDRDETGGADDGAAEAAG